MNREYGGRLSPRVLTREKENDIIKANIIIAVLLLKQTARSITESNRAKIEPGREDLLF